MNNEPRLAASIEAMNKFFPDFALSFEQIDSGRRAVWEGWVQPIQSDKELAELLADIHQERPVHIMPGGGVRHDPLCNASHPQYAWMSWLRDLRISYHLEVLYSGGKAHPKAFVRNLRIPFHGANHLFRDDSICAYAPWQNVWQWDVHTVADYVGHALVWLIKWTVWCQAKVWIGPEISHERSSLVKTIDRNDECRCGSGRKYKKCHLLSDYNALTPPSHRQTR